MKSAKAVRRLGDRTSASDVTVAVSRTAERIVQHGQQHPDCIPASAARPYLELRSIKNVFRAKRRVEARRITTSSTPSPGNSSGGGQARGNSLPVTAGGRRSTFAFRHSATSSGVLSDDAACISRIEG